VKTEQYKKIGLLGGTFNPIHSGHLKAAEIILDKIGLEKILFIPSYVPPHKVLTDMAAPYHRLNMVKLAIAGNPVFEASSLEIDAEETSYSIITLGKIRNRYPYSTIFFIVGIDAFLEIKTWKEYKKVLKQCSFIVISRPGYHLEEAIKVLEGKYCRNIYEYQDDQKLQDAAEIKNGIILFRIPALDVSSTDIRRRLAAKEMITGLVPEPVQAYIQKHRLYQGTS
jgi:nicotinate-nucleotide adenylyltransferase